MIFLLFWARNYVRICFGVYAFLCSHTTPTQTYIHTYTHKPFRFKHRQLQFILLCNYLLDIELAVVAFASSLCWMSRQISIFPMANISNAEKRWNKIWKKTKMMKTYFSQNAKDDKVFFNLSAALAFSTVHSLWCLLRMVAFDVFSKHQAKPQKMNNIETHAHTDGQFKSHGSISKFTIQSNQHTTERANLILFFYLKKKKNAIFSSRSFAKICRPGYVSVLNEWKVSFWLGWCGT